LNRKLIEILACPIDKQFPLELFEISVKKDVILEGILYCKKCYRFFPIMEEIPIMLPDNLRNKKKELDFLKKNLNSLPEKIIHNSKPYHL